MDEDFRLLMKTKKYDNCTETYSTTGVPKMFPTVAPLLGLMHSCSRGIIQR
jgi:hypothetical protein